MAERCEIAESLGLALASVHLSSASAAPLVYNATTGKYTIEITLPNGAKENTEISPVTPGIDSESFTLAGGVKSVKVAILDDARAPQWNGVMMPDDTYVIVPDGADGKIKAVYSGGYGGADRGATALPLRTRVARRRTASAAKCARTAGTSTITCAYVPCSPWFPRRTEQAW